jgi:hypothetical protein
VARRQEVYVCGFRIRDLESFYRSRVKGRANGHGDINEWAGNDTRQGGALNALADKEVRSKGRV